EIVLRAGVSGRKADAAARSDAGIDAGDEAGEISADARHIAVAVELAPRAESLRPEHHVGGRDRRERGRLRHDWRLRIGKRAADLAGRRERLRSAGLQGGHRAARTERAVAIARLAQPPKDRGARIE